MQYKLTTLCDGIIRTDDEGIISFVPNEPYNRDWVEYQAWLAADPENNIPEPADDGEE